MAEIKATIEANKGIALEDQSMTDAKLEVERRVEGNESGVLVEPLPNKPTLWGKIKAYFIV